MATIYDNFQDARDKASNDWIRNFVLPYGNAYNSAYRSFKDTLKEQEEADKAALERNLQIALFALSLCGGSLLTHVFGSAALKEVAAKVAVDRICHHGMERAFKAAAFIERNKAAQFMLGELWGKGEGWIGDKIKDGVKSTRLEETTNNYKSLASFAEEPQNMQNNLEKWVRDIYAIVLDTGVMLNNNLNQDTIQQPLKKLMSSQFFASAPKQSLEEKPVSIDIELTFFMKIVLDMDYLVKGYWEETGRNFNMRQVITSRTPIPQDPTGKDYPNTSKYYTSDTNFETVEYKKIGDIIKKRINELHKSKFGVDFFEKSEKTSLKTLQRAQLTLVKLEERNLANLIQRMGQARALVQ